MKSQIGVWTAAFLVTSTAAVSLLASASRERHNLPADVVVQRDPAKMSDADLELVLNKIREGDLLATKGELAKARAAWTAAREQGKGYWPLHEGLGESYARNGMYSEAADEFETAEKLAVDLPDRVAVIKSKRARVEEKQEKYSDALVALIEAAHPDELAPRMAAILQKAPELINVVAQRAEAQDARLWKIVAMSQKDPVAVAVAWGKYVRGVVPWDGSLCRRSIEDLRKHSRIDEAIAVCRAWAKSSPQDIQIHIMMGDILQQAGRADEALLAYTSIVDIRTGDADVHREMGVIFRKLGRYDESLKQFGEAKKIRGEEPFWIQEIAATLVAMGKTAEADAKYEELLTTKWDGRFGDVKAQVRPKFAEMYQKRIDEAKKAGNTQVVHDTRIKAGQLGLPECGIFDIKIVMTWDTRADVDLDVVEPSGEVINHGKADSKAGGKYYYDNTQAFGPEHYTILKAPPGKYKIGAHLHGGTKSTVKFEVILHEDQPDEKRWTDSLILESQNGQVWLEPFEMKP